MSAVWRVQRGFWHPIFIQPLPLGLELFMKSRRRSDAERAREKIQSDALPSRQAHSSGTRTARLERFCASFGVTPGAPLGRSGRAESGRTAVHFLRPFACTGATSLFAEPAAGPFWFRGIVHAPFARRTTLVPNGAEPPCRFRLRIGQFSSLYSADMPYDTHVNALEAEVASRTNGNATAITPWAYMT